MKYKIITIVVMTIIMMGCNKERTYFPSYNDMTPKKINIIRFDSALLHVKKTSITQDIQHLYQEYPNFMPLFVEDILGIPSTDTAYLKKVLPEFLQDTVYGFLQTNQYEQTIFSNIADIQTNLNEAFTRLCYLYPEIQIPDIYLFISGFNASIYFFDGAIAVGADMYLGSDYPLYNQVVYDYQKQTMRKECIPADVVSAYLFHNIPYTSTKNRLLEQMIYRGKVMYLLAQLFPDLPEYEVIGYSKKQLEWCKKYERDIWHLMMDKRDIFKTDHLILTSYLNNGPFTTEISQDSPGRVGIWVGWQIVKSYMNNNTDITLQDLMEEPDAQKILEKSFYKP